MLTGDLVERVDIPHEDGEWVSFRYLSWKDLSEAEQVRTQTVMDSARRMGADFYSALSDVKRDPDSGPKPEDSYDRGWLLRVGIADWSYKEPVSPEAVDRLDNRTAVWAIEQIVRINSLGSDPGRGEDSRRSTKLSKG